MGYFGSVCFLVAICFSGYGSAVITGHIAGDNFVSVYVDGEFVGENAGIDKGGYFSFPDDYKVIALRGVDLGGLGGFIGSFSNGLITDDSWRCTNTHHLGHDWMEFDYDDSHWEYATTYEHVIKKPYNIHHNAQWIWTRGYHSEDQIVACRHQRGSTI